MMPNSRAAITDDIVALLNGLIDSLKKLLEANLIGVYLHGSLAMGGFNPNSSDVDLLIVVKAKLSTATKEQIVKSLLLSSVKVPNNGIELTVVTQDAIQAFQYPTPYELHFSNAWKARYIANEVNLDEEKFDPDLAAHFKLTRNLGLCLYGQPIALVFKDIPDQFFLKSILNDAHDILDDISKNPVYGVLNLCRILAYINDKHIISKVDGGEWGLKHVDPQFTPLIRKALAGYMNQSSTQISWDKQELENFADHMRLLLAFDLPASSTVS